MKRYSLDPGQITLDHFKEFTRNKRMVKGRVALRSDWMKDLASLKDRE